jgi:hypothetical protein
MKFKKYGTKEDLVTYMYNKMEMEMLIVPIFFV